MSSSSVVPFPIPSNPAELSEILGMLYAPDNNLIQRSTATIKEFFKTPNFLPAMLQQATQNDRWQSRQMAAVLLRQRIQKSPKLAKAAREELKRALLDRLVNEPERLVRLSIAALTAIVAKVLVPKKEWPGFFEFLEQLSKSDNPTLRELSMKLFGHLADTMANELRPHFRTLRAIFIGGLGDSNDRVRLEALKAVETLIQLIDPEREADVMAFKEIVPPFCTVVQQYVQSGNDEVVSSAMEVFDSLAQTSLPVLDDHLGSIVQMMLAISTNTGFELTTREKACQFVAAVLEAKPMKLTKLNLIDTILQAMIAVVIEPVDDQIDSSEMTPSKIAIAVLDGIFLNVPKRLFYNQTLAAIAQLTQSAQKYERRGGYIILSVMAEGCADLFSDRLKDIVMGICKGIADAEPNVRAAAWTSLIQLCDQLPEEVSAMHADLIPVIINSLRTPGEEDLVRQKCCIALECLCENLESEQITPHLNQLMQLLVQLLRVSGTVVQEAVISSIKAMAGASSKAFLPFFEGTMQILGPLMVATNDEFLALRCRATECVGMMAAAVGKENFCQKYLTPVMDTVVKGMDLSFFELRESSFVFFGKVAEAMGEDFQPLVRPVMEFVLAALASDDGIVTDGPEELDGAQGIEFSDDEADEDDEELDETRATGFSIRSGALDEKIAACACLCSVIQYAGKHFLPFVDKTMEYLDQISEYPHPFIRTAVVEAHLELIKLCHVTFPNPRQWQRGEIVKLHDNSRTVIDKVLPLILQRMEEEDERQTAATACSAVSEIIQMFGRGCLTGKNPLISGKKQAKNQVNYDLLIEHLEMFLREKGPCQRPQDDEDEEMVADHDEVLIDAVTDLIEDLSKVCGEAFLPAFKRLFPLIAKFAEPEKPVYDRSMSVGCFAECFNSFNSTAAMQPFLSTLIPICIRGLNDREIAVRRNAAYLCGVLCLYGGETVASGATTFLEPLGKQFSAPNAANPEAESVHSAARNPDELRPVKDSDFFACRDNAVSALCKMIKAFPQAIPLEQVLTLAISGMPLVDDQQEAKNVYPLIISLYKTHLSVIGPHTGAVIKIFTEVFGHPEVEIEVQQEMIAFIKALSQENAGAVQQVVQTFKQEMQERFQKFMSQ